MKKWVKITLITCGLAVGLIIVLKAVFLIFLDSALPGGRGYTSNELIESFDKKRSQIYEVKRYYKTVVPQYKDVDIEFEDEKIARLVISPQDTGRGSDMTVEFQDWNIPIKSEKADSVLKLLGWNSNILQTLQNKLNDANCISIVSGEPGKIGFKRSGMGMYFFNVFDKPIPDSLKSRYNDSCTYIYANKFLVLEYGGGAVGPQCFATEKHLQK